MRLLPRRLPAPAIEAAPETAGTALGRATQGPRRRGRWMPLFGAVGLRWGPVRGGGRVNEGLGVRMLFAAGGAVVVCFRPQQSRLQQSRLPNGVCNGSVSGSSPTISSMSTGGEKERREGHAEACASYVSPKGGSRSPFLVSSFVFLSFPV